MKNAVLAVTAIAGIAASANAAWGYKYQFNTGSGWTNAASVDVSGGAVTVQFRVVAYADAGTLSSLLLPAGADAGSTNQVIAFARYVGSDTFQNFGAAANGDMLVTHNRGQMTANGTTFLSNSLSSGNMILGNSAITSFSGQTILSGGLDAFAPNKGGTPVLEWVVRGGSIKVGNNTVAASNRVITFKNNTRTPGNGGSQGDKWYRDAAVNGTSDPNSGLAEGAATLVDGTLTVVPTPGALALVGLGGLVAARRRRA